MDIKIKYLKTVAIVWHPAIIYAIEVAARTLLQFGFTEIIITGAQEGKGGSGDLHSEGSLHYGLQFDPRCRAFDFRLPEFDGPLVDPNLDVKSFLMTYRQNVGMSFDVVLESTKNAKWVHTEFDPRFP